MQDETNEQGQQLKTNSDSKGSVPKQLGKDFWTKATKARTPTGTQEMTIQELQNLTLAHRATLLGPLYTQLQGRVTTGPFTGMQLVPEVCWGDGDTAAKLLGVYEQELQDTIKRVFIEPCDLVINVGSAEGYYAVGMARRMGCRTIAVDTDARARTITEATAAANGVTVETLDSITPSSLQDLLSTARRPFVIMDCEGAERELLDPVQTPALTHTRLLIESHECFVPGITQVLQDRFAATHLTRVIRSGGRNPSHHKILDQYWDLEKWILINECRPQSGEWIWMEPK